MADNQLQDNITPHDIPGTDAVEASKNSSKVTKLSRPLTWVACSSVLFFFTNDVFVNYLQHNPVTILTFVDQPKQPAPVVVRICNSVHLDPEKIMNYNGSQIELKTYEFLRHAVAGDDNFDDSSFVLQSVYFDYFIVSHRILETFKLDKDEFLVKCFTVGLNWKECSHQFQWYADKSSASCFKAEIDIGGYGVHNMLSILFYFDPTKTLG